jgi:DMSO reductase anchor subunit
MGAAAFCPLIEIVNETPQLSIAFHSYGIGAGFPTWGVLTFAVASGLLAFINIFLYKKRKLQINIGYLTAILIIVYYITTMVYMNAFLEKIDSTYTINIQFGIILPVAALIFDLLAISRIKKDEKLVKSLDRIR